MPTITHISTLSRYRSPLGAVPTGETVLLRFAADEGELTGAKLRIYIGDQGSEYDMAYRQGYWEYAYPCPEEETVVWYSFTLLFPDRVRWLGPEPGNTQGRGVLFDDPCLSFQLTVYAKGFDTPAWFRKSTMYQIFPDRFCRGDAANLERGITYHRRMGRKVIAHESWEEPLLYEPLEGEKYYSPCDFYGGDLRGIIQSLPYLKDLGIGVLYLNPIVEADSNHRYNTADYMKVDPVLGTNADFAELCQKAGEMGIRVMYDGVYSHTGSDSRYFNKLGNYEETGAFQGSSSPYYKWYTFFSTRYNYKCWWGFDTLPEVNENDKSWQRYVISGRHSVFAHWTALGAQGVRLDVADELPDEVIALMRTSLKHKCKDNVLLGEVWEDATTKHSYGCNRKYALGNGLDSVMNYPFRNACLAFLTGQTDAAGLTAFLMAQRMNYPKPMYYALMNLLSSHDIPRIRTVLSTGLDGENMSREEQAALEVTPEQEERGRKLELLAAMLQFAIPGVPSIYYGDEFGMHGLKDPFNRAPFTRRDGETYRQVRQISVLRKQYPALQGGFASFSAPSADVAAVLRFHLGGTDAFGQVAESSVLLVLVNRAGQEETAELELDQFAHGLDEPAWALFRRFLPNRATELLSGKERRLNGRSIQLPVPGQGYAVYELTGRMAE